MLQAPGADRMHAASKLDVVDDIHYRRSRFSTRLAGDRLYTASHFWLQQEEPGVWRVGVTKFAARMLGDVVDIGFDVAPGARISLGDTLGWFEGFKARSDLYSVATGTFGGANPDLDADVDVIDRDRYGRGWLYRVHGMPDPDARDAAGYARLLDETIDRMRGLLPQERT
jgi:glycine cleavage system H protein